MSEIYEAIYTRKHQFSFGKNWSLFLTTLNEERIKQAEASLTAFLGPESTIKGKTFVDVGCGSGLFSLAAFQLGAKRVVSVDVDEASLDCALLLKRKFGNPAHWEVKRLSALDPELKEKLGTFDIVYSWGVLHHTGSMYKAIRNAATLVSPNGYFYIALYNENRRFWEGTSSFWASFKRWYSRQDPFVKRSADFIYCAYYTLGLLIHGKNPLIYVRSYRNFRGMNFMTDIRDWLGGYPYEYATVDQIVEYFAFLGFESKKTVCARSLGCNEFLFERAHARKKASYPLSILLSAYNGSKTLDRCLQSLKQQTFQEFEVVAVDDASTDSTRELLEKWQKDFGVHRFRILKNDENLGLTLSLNRGLSFITSPYTARLDCDDWWESAKLSAQMSHLAEHSEIGVLGTNYTNHGANITQQSHLPLTDTEIRSSMITKNPFAHSAVVFQTELVKRAGMYNAHIRYGQDYELWLRLFPRTRFANLKEALCHRSIGRGISATHLKAQMHQGMATQMKYIRLYGFSPLALRHVGKLWLIAHTPNWLRWIRNTLTI